MTRIPIRRMPLKRPPVVADRVIGQPLRWYQVQWDGGGGDYTDDGWYHDDEDDPTPSAGDTACLWRVTPDGSVMYWWDQTDDLPCNDIAFGDDRVWVSGWIAKVWVGRNGTFGSPLTLGTPGESFPAQRIDYNGFAAYSNILGIGRFDADGNTTWTASIPDDAHRIAIGPVVFMIELRGATGGSWSAVRTYDSVTGARGSDLPDFTYCDEVVPVGSGVWIAGMVDLDPQTIAWRPDYTSSAATITIDWDAAGCRRDLDDMRVTGTTLAATFSESTGDRVAAFDTSDGSVRGTWTPDFGASNVLSCDVDAAGNIYVAGVHGLAKYAADGTRAWQIDGLSGYRVRIDDDGCAWVVGDRRYYDGTDWIAVP